MRANRIPQAEDVYSRGILRYWVRSVSVDFVLLLRFQSLNLLNGVKDSPYIDQLIATQPR